MNLRIVIADDQKNMRDQLMAALTLITTADNIRQFNDGEPAIKCIREWTPDLVILDIIMNGMTGLEVVRTLRAEGNHVPVILSTSMGQDRAAHGIHVQGLIMKPLITDVILEKVVEALDGGH